MAQLARMPAGMGMAVQYHPTSWIMTPPIDLSPVGIVGSSLIEWEQETQPGTRVIVEASLDGGQTWKPCTSGQSIPGLGGGLVVTGLQLLIRVTLATNDTAITPHITLPLTVEVSPLVDEWVPLGLFWATEWQAEDDTVEASVVARDRLELLRKSTYQTSQVLQNTNLHDLAVLVLADAGLDPEEYWVDPALQQIRVPYAWFDPVSHREALRIIAEAGLAQVYCDRDGVVRMERQPAGADPVLEITADDYYRLSNPMRPNQVANEVIVSTSPLRPADVPEEVYRSNEPIMVPAGKAVTVTVYYQKTPVIDATASLDGAPAGVAITQATYYGWGAEVTIQNTGGTDADVILVVIGRPLSVQNRERAVARDEASIIENGVLRYEFPDNPLVQSLAVAQEIADRVLASAKDARRDLEIDWRGNPALELGDVVTVKGRQYTVIRQEINWAGALSENTTGRRVS